MYLHSVVREAYVWSSVTSIVCSLNDEHVYASWLYAVPLFIQGECDVR